MDIKQFINFKFNNYFKTIIMKVIKNLDFYSLKV